MSDIIVETLPVLSYKDVYELAKIRKMLQEGDFDLTYSPSQIIHDAYESENDERLETSRQQEDDSIEPSLSKNIEDLYYLTSSIQGEISFVLLPPFTGKLRHDNMVRERIERFLNESIPLFSSQLVTYIESLIIIDHFPSSKFHGYKNLERMIATSQGNMRINHLQSLVNMCRQIIPVDVTMKQVKILYPAISKNANPRDA